MFLGRAVGPVHVCACVNIMCVMAASPFFFQARIMFHRCLAQVELHLLPLTLWMSVCGLSEKENNLVTEFMKW